MVDKTVKYNKIVAHMEKKQKERQNTICLEDGASLDPAHL
jgi:hypothetical protein